MSAAGESSRRSLGPAGAPAESAHWAVALVCFGLSGASALLFQTAWTQQLGLIFGASELAVISVLAAFMAGLALGSHFGGRWASGVRRPLLAYGLVEAAIAGFALLLPMLLRGAAWAQRRFFTTEGFDLDAGLGALTSFHLAGAALLLLPPTFLMGASLPLLVRSAVRRESALGRRVGALYASNTLGAALGALLTGFVLLPRLGLGRAIYVGVGLNLAVALLAVLASLRARVAATPRAPVAPVAPMVPIPPPAPDDLDAASLASAPGPRWPLAVAALTGGLALSLELLWTRLLTFALGGSVYSFAAMLATFLLAIALGTALATRFARSAAQAAQALSWFLLVAGIATPLALAAADRLPRILEAVSDRADPLLLATLLGAALMFPGALAFGACFPMAVRAAAQDARTAAASTGAVLAANTAGAVVGVVATGLVLLPQLGFHGLSAVVSALALGAALVLAVALRPRERSTRLVAGAVVLAGGALLLAPPATPWNLLRMSPTAVLAARAVLAASAPLAPSAPTGETTGGKSAGRVRSRLAVFGPVVFAGIGRSATVLLHREGLEWRMTSNGLPESAMQPRGGRVARYAVARWLTLLPTALRPGIDRLLVIGLGAGHSVEALPASIAGIDVVELEPEIVRANRAVAPLRRSDPLADPRVALHLGDGRSALALHRELFDAIVSQPSHPWTAGSASLFTQEFFSLVHGRLKPGGIFVQWIGLDFVDVALLRSLVATLRSVFPFVECYRPHPGGAVLFVASDRELADLATARRAIARDAAAWSDVGVLSAEDLALARILDDNGSRRFAAGAEPTRDLRNLLQTRSPRILGQSRGPEELEAALSPYDALRDLPRDLDGAYLVRRLLEQGAPARALRLATELRDDEARRSAFGWLDAYGYAPADSGAAGGAAAAPPAAASPEALAMRLLALRAAARSEAARGTTHDAGRVQPTGELADWVARDPAADALVEAWHALTASDEVRWSELDLRLAAIDPRHPLREAATRARIAWRLQSGDPLAAAAALPMLDALLARKSVPIDLALRATLGLAARDRWTGFAALDELARMLADESPQRGARIREARRLLRDLAAAPPALDDQEKQAEEILEAALAELQPEIGKSGPPKP